jgi:ATP-dependent helicase HrpA
VGPGSRSPGSGLFKKQPDFVIAGELVETTKLWGRQVAVVDPAWVEQAAEHLVSRTWAEPYWSKKRAAVLAHERVTLYGVPLIADRLVNFGKIDQPVSRELFIRHALVQGEWHTRHHFFATNRDLLEQAEELEHRARRRDLVVDEQTLFEFYDGVVPAEIVSGAHFDSWWKKARRDQPELLTFDPAMLLHDIAAEVTAGDFPDLRQEGSTEFPLSYHFEPGADQDGVRVDVPLATLNHLGAAAFSWHVPGLREELVIALLRSLPKQLRVNFVPAPNFARGFLSAVPPGEESLTEALTRHLRALTGVAVPTQAWDWSKVPDHLKPSFRIVDEAGEVLGEGKDLEALKRPLRASFEEAMAGAAAQSGMVVTGQVSWTFGTIEQSFRQVRAGHEVHGFPALVDEGSTVGLQVFGTASEQQAQHLLGVRRLLMAAVPAPNLEGGLDNATKLTLAGSPYPTVKGLLADCAVAAFGDLTEPVWDEAGFEALVMLARARIEEQALGVRALVLRILTEARETDRLLHGRVELAVLPSMNDMRQHFGRLLAPGFVAEAGSAQLKEIPRYLAGINERHRKLVESPVKDLEQMSRVGEFQNGWEQRTAALPPTRPPGAGLVRLRWLIEEYRVSLWAQQLGTKDTVSDSRLRAALNEA